MFIKKIFLLIPIILINNTFAQEVTSFQSRSYFDVQADIVGGCLISTEDINFGIIFMPLNEQISRSNISLQCSKNIISIISISYSNKDSPSITYNLVRNSDPKYPHEYFIYDNNNKLLGNPKYISFGCFGTSVIIGSKEVAELYGMPTTNTFPELVVDTAGICNPDDRTANYDTFYKASNTSQPILKGVSKGEQINYYLTVPNQEIIWNENNTFSLIANGKKQTIPMNAKINKSETPKHYLSADTYKSVLTVLISY